MSASFDMGRAPSTASELEGPSSGVRRTPVPVPAARPLLASEVLREELAPLEPGRQSCRFWLVAAGVVLALLGLAFRLGVGIPATRLAEATLSFSAAGALVAMALLPFPYGLRAGVTLLVALALAALGLRGAGPLAGLAVDGGLLKDVASLVALTTLPAALLFRARYRAYRAARLLLALALTLSLPFVVFEGLLASQATAPLWMRLAAAGNVAAVATSLFGFMGQDTTGASSVWAVLVVLMLPVEIGLRQLSPLADAETGFLTYPATAVALGCVGLLGALSLYQLLAAALGPSARARALAQSPPQSSA